VRSAVDFPFDPMCPFAYWVSVNRGEIIDFGGAS
jgi:hypothetical protein